MGSRIQATVKGIELSLVMTVCRYGFHNGVKTYMLEIGESTIHKIFVTWKVFLEAIFPCLNLIPDERFLP